MKQIGLFPIRQQGIPNPQISFIKCIRKVLNRNEIKTIIITCKCLVILLFVSAGIGTSAYSQCVDKDDIFTFINGDHTYEVIKSLKTWADAADCAVERGGYLVEINSQSEQDTVYQAIVSGAGIPSDYTQVLDGGGIAYLWIGATDQNEEGEWIWDGDGDGNGVNFWKGQGLAGAGDGAPVEEMFYNWGGSTSGDPNEPDDYGANQDGAAIGLAKWPAGMAFTLGIASEWNDINTDNELYFVVEYNYADTSFYVDIPDTAFLYALIDEGVDTDGDSLISYEEAATVKYLDLTVGCGGGANLCRAVYGCFGGEIRDLTGIEAFTNLDTLMCGGNKLSTLSMSGNPSLKYLECIDNSIIELDVSGNDSLLFLDCKGNQLSGLDVTNNVLLEYLTCFDNPFRSLHLCENIHLKDLWGPELDSLFVWKSLEDTLGFVYEGTLDSMYCSWYNARQVIYCDPDLVYIPDTAFLYALLDEGVDTDGDSLISYSEAENVIILDVDSAGISDMTGIEVFSNLLYLSCESNQLNNLDVSNNESLLELNCAHNQLYALDVSECQNLVLLYCYDNQLEMLNVSNIDSLVTLDCSQNDLSSLDVSKNVELIWLYCKENQLEELDVSNNKSLALLNCSQNDLFSLDVSNNTNLGISPSGWGNVFGLYIADMPTLREVCVWEIPFPPLDLQDDFVLDTTNSPNVCFQTDCNGDCSIVGIDDIHCIGISIHPNPTHAIINIETVTAYPVQYELYSLNGQLILDGEMNNSTQQLDLSSFQKGVYVLTIRSEDFVITRKIIKH